MYLGMQACMFACLYICVFECSVVCMFECMTHMCVRMSVCMCVCVCMCVNVCVCVCVLTHAYSHQPRFIHHTKTFFFFLGRREEMPRALLEIHVGKRSSFHARICFYRGKLQHFCLELPFLQPPPSINPSIHPEYHAAVNWPSVVPPLAVVERTVSLLPMPRRASTIGGRDAL